MATKIKTKEELGNEVRFLRATRDRNERTIEELKEQINGYEELIAINNALVAAVLIGVGAVEERPLYLERDAVTKAMKADVKSQFSAKDNNFSLFAVMKEEQA